MKKFILASLLLCSALVAKAQNTTVSGTVTDSDGIAWANGTINFQLVNPGGQGGNPKYNGTPLTPSQTNITVALSGTGTFSQSVFDVTQLTPAGLAYNISICPLASSPCQSLNGITIAGATMNLTSTISGVIQPLRVSASYVTKAYSSVEISPIPPAGATYYDLTLQKIQFWTGSAWASVGSGLNVINGSGPPTVVCGSSNAGQVYNDQTANQAYWCNGATNTWVLTGTIVSASANVFLGLNNGGNIVGLPEFGTSTTGATTTVAWIEDQSRGLFDPRRPRIEKITGSNTLVSLTSNAALALQQTLNDANCYTAQTGKAATVVFPPGKFNVGVTQAPTLISGPGMNIYGTAGGTVGVGGNNNETGTQFQGTYTNSPVFVVTSPYSSPCQDGTTRSNGKDGGDVENIQAFGTTNTGGTQTPGNPYTGTAGPQQTGIFIGIAHGTARNLRVAFTGGTGIDNNGLDSDFYDEWTYDSNTWYRFDRGNGITYNPATDGFHGGIELNGGDSRLTHIETYGTFNTPSTEFGHVCGIVLNAGGNRIEGIFQQIDEYGICRPSTAGSGGLVNIANVRSEGNSGPDIKIDSVGTVITNFQASQGCKYQAGVIAMGFCDDIMDSSAGGAVWVGGIVYDNPPLGTSYRTGFISPGFGTFIGVQPANGDGIDRQGGVFGTDYPGHGMVIPDMDSANPFGGNVATGATPDLGAFVHVLMKNTSATNITSATKPRIGQHWAITLFGPNDTLVSNVNGGTWFTCNGANLTGPGGPYDFYVFNTGLPTVVYQQANCPLWAADKTSTTTQAFNGQITAPQFEGAFVVDQSVPTTCTYGGVNYTTRMNCAYAKAADWVNTNNQNAALWVPGGTWPICQQMIGPSVNSSVSILGLVYSGSITAGSIIQQSATAGCTTNQPMLVQPTVNLLNEQKIADVVFDGNHKAECADIFGVRRSVYDFGCVNPKGDHAVQIGDNTNLPYELRVPHIVVRTAAYGGAVTYPTFTVPLTGGAVSGWTVTNAGSFPSFWPLVAYIAPGTQCTTPPTAPTIQLSAPSGGLVTVTGLTTTGSAGVGCTAVYVQVFEAPEVNYGVITNTTDSTFNDVVITGAAATAAVQNNHGDNQFGHIHGIGHSPVLVEEHGRNSYNYVECDSPAGWCFSFLGSHTSVFGMTSTWNANVYSGSGDMFIAGSQVANSLFSHTCPGTQTAGGYVEINTPSGPFVPNQAGVFPGGGGNLSILGPNIQCDGTNADGGNYVLASYNVGGFNASKMNLYADGAGGTNVLNIGSGANVTNGLNISGRASMVWNGSTQVANLNSKGWLFTTTGGNAGGWTPASTPYQQIGTAIASAATITPGNGGVFHVTGTTPIATMTVPGGCNGTTACRVTLWPDAIWTITTTGNFINATTAVVGRPLDCTYDFTLLKWGCSY